MNKLAKNKIVDISAIIQVIGCVYLNPSLIDQNEKYTFTLEDFTEDFHKVIFGSIYNLYQYGAKKIEPSTIEDYLSSYPKKLAIYQVNKGDEYLQKISEKAQPAAFDFYYNRMKKFTLLRMYDDIGLNISDIYDIDNAFDIKKKQHQEEWLNNTDIEEIAETIDKKITDIKLKYANIKENDFHQGGDKIDELIENLKNNPDIGVPLYGNFINTITRGARLGKFYLRSMPTGVGKALPNDTLIPTPDGWKKVGDIRPGDYLFGQDGNPTGVLAIHPQSGLKQVWEVVFKDGRVVKCCKDHLWEYRYDRRHNLLKVESTEEIYKKAKESGGFKDKGYRFAVRMNEPVAYPTKKLYPSPYAMGALLGDGSFRYNSNQKSLSFSSADDELPNRVAKELGKNIVPHKSSNFNYSYTFKPIENSKHNLWVEEILCNYPELWNAKSEDKFIPEEYLMSDIYQRYALLEGLLDTDGHIDEKGRISYYTISSKLKDNVIELCRSLGMITSVILDKRKGKYTTEVGYIVHIQCCKSIKPMLFSLKRKKAIAEAFANNGKREEKKDFLPIVDIYPTNEYTNMTCFTVDNKDHLFLANDFIVTHNTRMMVADACYIACNKIYNTETNSWEDCGNSEPTLFIATEQDLAEIQTAMLAFLSAVNEEHILTGAYEEDEFERVKYAASILKESPLYVKELPDFSLKDIENTIKFAVHDWNIKYCLYDYLHSSTKILSEVSSKARVANLREDNVLFMISTTLKELCTRYGIFILTSTQLNGQYSDAEIFDQNLLRGAKSIADKCDIGMIGLTPTERDKEALSEIVSKLGMEMPNVKISVYKNRRGRWKDIILWCNADKGTCRYNPMFITNYNYELIEMKNLKINVLNFEE